MMCVILDTSVSGLFFSPSGDNQYTLVRKFIRTSSQLIYGGRLAKELMGTRQGSRYIRELDRAGRAKQFRDVEINRESNSVSALGICISNDHHILALARLSGARILCTNDSNLETDFKNTMIIPTPKGKIYKKRSHRGVLKRCKHCPSA